MFVVLLAKWHLYVWVQHTDFSKILLMCTSALFEEKILLSSFFFSTYVPDLLEGVSFLFHFLRNNLETTKQLSCCCCCFCCCCCCCCWGGDMLPFVPFEEPGPHTLDKHWAPPPAFQTLFAFPCGVLHVLILLPRPPKWWMPRSSEFWD